MSSTVTFFTNCWEGDWRYLLKTPRLENMIANNDYQFKEKILCISNVDDPTAVMRQADKLIKKGVLDSYFLAQNCAKEALAFFDLSEKDLRQSYKYSIPPLTCLYLCKTEYLVHHTGDVILPQKSDWITPSLAELGKNSQAVVANPVWDSKYEGAKSESMTETDSFFVGYGFSDQCYLIRCDTFKRPIYQEWNEASARFPEHGMWGFERRIDSWMRNHQFTRLTFKGASYRHDSFPRTIWRQRLEVFLGTRNKK